MTIQQILQNHNLKKASIRKKLAEFENVKYSSDEIIFEELVLCILTAGASAKMGISSINVIKDVLFDCTELQLVKKLRGVYRFPNVRSKYIIHTRNYLKNAFNMQLKRLLFSFEDSDERRKFFALNKDIKGIGPKESSHFLRNIGFKGYAILDKHILNCLYELKVTKSAKPPTNLKKYKEIENQLKKFSIKHKIDFEELDLLLWSEKTGEVLK